jgi:hypothetical protein
MTSPLGPDRRDRDVAPLSILSLLQVNGYVMRSLVLLARS